MTCYQLVCTYSHPEGYVDIVNYDSVFGGMKSTARSSGKPARPIGVAQRGYALDVLRGLDYVQTVPGIHPMFSSRAVECLGEELLRDVDVVPVELEVSGVSLDFALAIVKSRRALVDDYSSEFMTLAGVRIIKNAKFNVAIDEDFMIARDVTHVHVLVSDVFREVSVRCGLSIGFSPI